MTSPVYRPAGSASRADPARSSTRSPGKGYELRDVAVDFPSADGTRSVLKDVSFRVAPAEIVGIVGRSGTGKTTLMRVLGGLLPVTRGLVELDGEVVNSPPGTAITVFQDYANALLPWRTVARNVGLGLEKKGYGKAEREERVSEALRLVGLEGRERDHPWRLSGGMQQRVQIARALAVSPRVLLMDEPFGALDAMTRASLQDELLAAHQRMGTTIIFITHDLDEALYLSDRVLVIAGAPGMITLEIETNLPRPRSHVATREQPEYGVQWHRLGEALQLEGHSTSATPGPPRP